MGSLLVFLLYVGLAKVPSAGCQREILATLGGEFLRFASLVGFPSAFDACWVPMGVAGAPRLFGLA